MTTLDYTKLNRANINILGKRCNLNCYFCTNNCEEFKHSEDYTNKLYSEFKCFGTLLKELKQHKIYNLNLKGFNMDIALYSYLDLLYVNLINIGFKVSIETNGYIDISHLYWFTNNTIFYNVFSLSEAINRKITGAYDIPNWDRIIPNSGKDVSIIINVCRYNEFELPDIIAYFSKFNNVHSIQLKSTSIEGINDELALDESAFNNALIYTTKFDKCIRFNDEKSLNYFSNGKRYTTTSYIQEFKSTPKSFQLIK